LFLGFFKKTRVFPDGAGDSSHYKSRCGDLIATGAILLVTSDIELVQYGEEEK
jgi:hypothetical protein